MKVKDGHETGVYITTHLPVLLGRNRFTLATGTLQRIILFRDVFFPSPHRTIVSYRVIEPIKKPSHRQHEVDDDAVSRSPEGAVGRERLTPTLYLSIN